MTIGVYLINVDPVKSKGWLGPLRLMWLERGNWLYWTLAMTIAIGFAIPADKMCIAQSNALFAPGLVCVVAWFGFGIIVISTRKEKILQSLKRAPRIRLIKTLLLFFLFNVILVSGHGFAYVYGYAPSVGSLKRLDLVAVVLIGYYLRKEENIVYRISGSVCCALGAILIGLDSQ